MLTGDKGATAQNIGIACGLLSQPNDKTTLLIKIEDEFKNIPELIERAQGKFELMISGTALSLMLLEEKWEK